MGASVQQGSFLAGLDVEMVEEPWCGCTLDEDWYFGDTCPEFDRLQALVPDDLDHPLRLSALWSVVAHVRTAQARQEAVSLAWYRAAQEEAYP